MGLRGSLLGGEWEKGGVWASGEGGIGRYL